MSIKDEDILKRMRAGREKRRQALLNDLRANPTDTVHHHGSNAGELAVAVGGGNEEAQALYRTWSNFVRHYELTQEAIATAWTRTEGSHSPGQISIANRLLNHEGIVSGLFLTIAAKPKEFFAALNITKEDFPERSTALVNAIQAAIATQPERAALSQSNPKGSKSR